MMFLSRIFIFSLVVFHFYFVSAQEPTCSGLLRDSQLQVQSTSGYIQTSGGLPLYYERWNVRKSKGLLVVANGLHYELKNYQQFAAEVTARGYSLLIYAHRGQHQSEARLKEMNLDLADFSYEDLAQDLRELLEALKIRSPVHLAGLSFGSSVAAAFATQFPDRVASLHFWAPLVRLASGYSMWRDAEKLFSGWNPFFWWNTDYSSAYEKMISAVEGFDLGRFQFQVPTYLYLAGQDQTFLLDQQMAYWSKVLQNQNSELIRFEDASHGLPASIPDTLAQTFKEKIESID